MSDPNFDGMIDPPAEWADIPRASTDMLLLGGEGGPLNAQAVALAKRLKFLKALVEQLSTSAGASKVGYAEAGSSTATTVEAQLRKHDSKFSEVDGKLQNIDGNLNFNTLPSATSPASNSDLMILRQGTANKKITVATIRAEFAADAQAASAAAAAARTGAEAARDAAQLASGVYASTAAGIAAVADGRYFSVPVSGGDDSLILYQRSGSSAVEVTRYPSSAYFVFFQKLNSLLLPAISDASGVELLGFDTTGAAVFKLSNYVLQQIISNASATFATIAAIDGVAQEPTAQMPGIVDASGVELLGFDDTGAARLRVSKSIADQVAALVGFTPYDPVAGGLLPKSTITCWGDSMTQGAGGNGTSITSVMGAILSRSVNNRGIGGQGATSIAIRQGGYPLTVTLAGNQIPASGGVAVVSKNNNILSAGGSFTGTVHVTIDGVPGTISTDSGGNWTFTRDTAGTAVTVAAGVQAIIDDVGTAFIPAPGPRRADTIVIWSGRNGVISFGRSAVIECRDRITDMVKYLTPLSKRVIVVSVCNGRRIDYTTGNSYEPSGSARYNDVIALNRELKETFGNSFVDLRYYMVNHAIYDAGLTPTATDLADIAADCIPTSLLADNVHFTSTGYTMAGQYLARQIIARGW